MRDRAAMTKSAPPVGDQITEQQDGAKVGGAAPGERGVYVTACGRMPPYLDQYNFRRCVSF